MIYPHWSDFDGAWRWPNFTPRELSCKHCGEYYHDPSSLDLIQSARSIYGAPIRLSSAHRCGIHNARVGGAPLSQHKKIAFDIQTAPHERRAIYSACHQAGFTTFGFYKTFLHVDIRRNRRWFGAGGGAVWNGLI